MSNDIKNSINKILNERITSPFYGTFILTWLIWNWRILYLTFFISEDKIKVDKISYIIANFSEIKYLILFPLITTIILISIFPLVTTRAYWIYLMYEQWKLNKRNEVQKKELLTLEQSINLREQIKSQEKRFEELLDDKNLKIKQLELQLKEIVPSDKVLDVAEKKVEALSEIDVNTISEQIEKNAELKKDFSDVSWLVQNRYRLDYPSNPPSTKNVNFFLSNNIITINDKGLINFTEFGKKVAKWINF